MSFFGSATTELKNIFNWLITDFPSFTRKKQNQQCEKPANKTFTGFSAGYLTVTKIPGWKGNIRLFGYVEVEC